MKKNLSIVFENCSINGDCIIEELKDETYTHNITKFFEQLNGESGLTITIKKATRTGEQDEVGEY